MKSIHKIRTRSFNFPSKYTFTSLIPNRRSSTTMVRSDPFKPAKRVAGQKQDVWYDPKGLSNYNVFNSHNQDHCQ